MKRVSKCLTALMLSFICLFGMGGVVATWSFADRQVAPYDEVFSPEMGVWGDASLPTDDEANQQIVAEKIVTAMNDPESQLNQNIGSRLDGAFGWGIIKYTTYGSMDTMKPDADILSALAENNTVSFIVEPKGNASNPNGTLDTDSYCLMYLYSTSVPYSDGNSWASGYANGQTITPVYRTTYVRRQNEDGSFTDWEDRGTFTGTAELAYYTSSTLFGQRSPAFDISSWVATDANEN